MTVFDLAFLVAVLCSAVVLIAVAVLAVRGQTRRARRVLAAYAIAAGGYLTAGVIVSGIEPQRVIELRTPWCFDDWCLTADRVTRTLEGATAVDRIDLRISSRARRVTQRANGAWIFLIDGSGHRYAPQPDSSAVPLDVPLRPGESVTMSRVFRLPATVGPVGLITGHGGDFCGAMSYLVIGQSGCLFHKQTMIRIEQGAPSGSRN
jgi:hypothetical protein